MHNSYSTMLVSSLSSDPFPSRMSQVLKIKVTNKKKKTHHKNPLYSDWYKIKKTKTKTDVAF